MFAVLFLLLFLAIPYNYVDNELNPYVYEYKQLYRHGCGKELEEPYKYMVKFANLPSPIVGLCQNLNVSMVILIDPDYFKKYTEVDRKSLMFHELSHCHLDKRHVDNSKNYMYDEMISIDEDELNRQTLEDIKNFCKE